LGIVATSNNRYTLVAAQAVSLAEMFAAWFAAGLDGPVHFGVELSAPDGPSTAGGKQALQHIKLVPAGGGAAVVIGSADTVARTAEIRTFEHVAALYAQRFRGAPIPVDPTRYQELSSKLAGFLRSQGLDVTFAALEPAAVLSAAASPAAAPSSGSLGLLVAAVMGLVVVVAAYALIFLRR
jgi:translation initiation factor IF-2